MKTKKMLISLAAMCLLLSAGCATLGGSLTNIYVPESGRLYRIVAGEIIDQTGEEKPIEDLHGYYVVSPVALDDLLDKNERLNARLDEIGAWAKTEGVILP